MADIIQQRRDTAARWAQYNPILLEGEVGYVTDNPNQYKIGNGVSRWNDLPLRGYNGTITQEKGNDENAVMSQAAVTKELSELGSEQRNSDLLIINILNPNIKYNPLEASNINNGYFYTKEGDLVAFEGYVAIEYDVSAIKGKLCSLKMYNGGNAYTLIVGGDKIIRLEQASGESFVNIPSEADKVLLSSQVGNDYGLSVADELIVVDSNIYNDKKPLSAIQVSKSINNANALKHFILKEGSKAADYSLDTKAAFEFWNSVVSVEVRQYSELVNVEDGGYIYDITYYNNSNDGSEYSGKIQIGRRTLTDSSFGEQWTLDTGWQGMSGMQVFKAIGIDNSFDIEIVCNLDMLSKRAYQISNGTSKAAYTGLSYINPKYYCSTARFEKIESDLQKVNENGLIYNHVSEDNFLLGKYLLVDGNLGELEGLNLLLFKVNENEYFEIESFGQVGSSRAFAFYNSEEVFNSETLLYISGKTIQGDSVIKTKAPIDSKTLLVYEYRNADVSVKKAVPIKDVVEELKEREGLSKIIENTFAKVKDGVLLVSSKHDRDNDIIIKFEKCMNNNLMTFFEVGLARNTLGYPSENIERTLDVVLNKATSDNIGPINVTGGGFVGANHCYLEDYERAIKTAVCDNYEFIINGRIVEEFEGYADSVEVRVSNTIFDPRVEPDTDASILSTPLVKEEVFYRIVNGNINVSLSHSYLSNAVVSYYGMQSIFRMEEFIITPNGLYTDFTAQGSVGNMIKDNYPKFNRFSERGQGQYQNTILLPISLGKHNRINDNSKIFTHSGSKCYHQLLADTNITEGETVCWSGVYNWEKPIVDDEYNYIYSFKYNNNIYLSVSSKIDYDRKTVEIPSTFSGKVIEVMESSDNLTIEDVSTNIMVLSSNSPSSIIVKLTDDVRWN